MHCSCPCDNCSRKAVKHIVKGANRIQKKAEKEVKRKGKK